MSGKRVDAAVLILRVAVGLIAMYYGSQKMFGLFHGPGVQGTIQYMEKAYSIPPVFAILAMCGEFFGGLGMVFGFLTNIAAFGFACTMAVATFENWKTPGLIQTVFTSPTPEDPSKVFFSFVLFFGALAVMLIGGGAYSLDSRFFGKKAPQKGAR